MPDVVPDLIAAPAAIGAVYCTIAEAQTAGATGTSDEITAAIAEATDRIDRYCADRFIDTTMTVEAFVDPDGVVWLPYTVQSVTAVRYFDASSDLTAAEYVLRTPVNRGGTSRIELVSKVGPSGENRVTVTGVFGWTDTPREIARACAQLAAWIDTHRTVGSDTTANVRSLSVEGYSFTKNDLVQNDPLAAAVEPVLGLLIPFCRRIPGIA